MQPIEVATENEVKAGAKEGDSAPTIAGNGEGDAAGGDGGGDAGGGDTRGGEAGGNSGGDEGRFNDTYFFLYLSSM